MKAIVEKIEEVPEALRSEYEQRDGKFVLKIEDDHPAVVDARNSVREFRDNNISLKRQVEELGGKLKSFEGIDPEKYREMTTRLSELEKKGVGDPSDAERRIREEVERQVGPLRGKVEEERKAREASELKLKERDREQKLREAGVAAGIAEHAMPDFIARGARIFDVDGSAKGDDGNILYAENSAKPLTMDDFANGLAKTAPHLFKQSKGGGAGGSSGPLGKKVIPDDPFSIGQNLEAIAKGEAQVESHHG